MEDKKISELTVLELKEIIREIVAEEITNRCFMQPLTAVPPQPFYYQPPTYPYQHQEVWADTKTTIIDREK